MTTTSDQPLRAAPDTFARREWPRAAWYAAAYDVEVGAHLLPRTVAGASLVLFRTPSGEARALENACWHRLLPLSEGKLLGDEVMCGYHGLRYDADGRCTFMPSQKTVNPSARVRSYPVVARPRFVFDQQHPRRRAKAFLGVWHVRHASPSRAVRSPGRDPAAPGGPGFRLNGPA